MGAEELAVVTRYFSGLSELQKNQLAQLYELYHDWNEKINVISRKDIDNLYTHHVLHSLSIAKFIQFKKETRILDVGTGGGFPGIPLAILFPAVNFFLVDSIAKKIKVVEAVAAAINLQNVTARQARVEEMKISFDFVVSRAVAQFSEIHQWTHRLVFNKSVNEKPNGWLLLKGGDIDAEMKNFTFEKVALETYFEEEFFKSKYLVYSPLTKRKGVIK